MFKKTETPNPVKGAKPKKIIDYEPLTLWLPSLSVKGK